MINIAVITNGTLPIPPTLGGAVENLLMSLIKKNENTNKLKFTIYSIREQRAVELSKNFVNTKFVFIDSSHFSYKILRGIRYLINKIQYNSIPNYFLSKVIHLLKKSEEYDLILLENTPNYLKFVNLNFSKPILLHLHNDYITNNVKLNNNLYSKANLILTVSNYLKNKIKTNTSVDLNLEVLHNGIDINRFHKNYFREEIQKLQSIYNIHENDFVIAYAGRLQEDKGVELVIDAFLKFNHIYESKLLIIGGSEFANKKTDVFAQKIIKKAKKQSNNIIFTNYIDYTKIHLYYQLPDVFVLPSLCEEAFGLTVLEALASSKPVIVTDAGGIPEIATKDCSIILKRGNDLVENISKSLQLIYENKEMREKLALNSQVRSKSFTDEIFYNNFIEIINKYYYTSSK